MTNNTIIIGEYPYPNKGTFLHKIGDVYYNVGTSITPVTKPKELALISIIFHI